LVKLAHQRAPEKKKAGEASARGWAAARQPAHVVGALEKNGREKRARWWASPCTRLVASGVARGWVGRALEVGSGIFHTQGRD